MRKLKVCFVTNFCPHYRVRTFETLARDEEVAYVFFSAGDEWYWQQQHGVQIGCFSYTSLPGVQVGQTRITPALPLKLWQDHHDVYVKCINGRFALPITYIIARLRRKPFILWTGIWMRLQTPAHRLFFPIARYIYRHADAVVVYGEHVKRYLITEGVPSERIFVAAHAVDNPVFATEVAAEQKSALLRKLDVSQDKKVILYLGRLEQSKGLGYLLNAFAALQRDDAVLILAGTGSSEAELRKLAEQQDIAHKVRFAGYVPQAQAVAYYAIAWVSVLPSVTTPTFKEPWGLVVNEAFNQGVPVIATEAVGAAAGGLVQNGVNGFVIPERNAAALAQALQTILEDPEQRSRMSQNAREIIARWDNEKMVMGFRRAIDYVTGRST
jgi:glycosyltransferase involved in cell wall biosynthesis